MGHGKVVSDDKAQGIDTMLRSSEKANNHLGSTYALAEELFPGIVGKMKKHTELMDNFIVGDEYSRNPKPPMLIK